MLTQEMLSSMRVHLSFMKGLDTRQTRLVEENARYDTCEAGFLYRTGIDECRGLVLVLEGQLRAFYESEDGKEITLYRLLSGDACVMTMSCELRNITFDISLEAEKPSRLITVPVGIFRQLAEANPLVRQFELDHVSARFSDVFWVMEQVVFKGMGQRAASFLLEQAAYQGSDTLVMTHESAARNLGTAREVVSRMFKYFESEGLISQARGKVVITDIKGLRRLSA